MRYLVTGVLLFVGLMEYRNHKTWAAPSVLFTLFWAVISFLAALRLFGLNDVRFITWFIIAIGVLSFVAGTKVKIMIKRDNSDRLEPDARGKLVSTKLYWVLFAIAGIYVTGNVIQTVRLLMRNISLEDIRSASFGLMKLEGYTYRSTYNAFFMRTLMTALQTVLIATGVDIFIREKDWKYIMAAIYLAICTAISAGGRWILAYFLADFLVCNKIMSGHGRKLTISPKIKRRALVSGLMIVVIIIAFFRISKGRDVEDIGASMYVYFCGCVPFLDIRLKEIDRNGIWSFIFASQYGFWSLFVPIMGRFTGRGIPLFTTTAKYIMTAQRSSPIGRSTNFNAFITGFYYLYADFRVPGVIIGMFLYGVLAGTLYTRIQTNNNTETMVPYMILLQTMIKSIQNYSLQSADYTLTFILLIIIYYARRSRIKVRLK